MQAELEKLDAQRAQATPPPSRATRVQYDKVPNLISFGSREDIGDGSGSDLELGEEEEGEGEGEVTLDTPL